MTEHAAHGPGPAKARRSGTRGPTDPAAREALTALCRALLEDVDGLADRLTVMILEREDVYGELGVPIDADLRTTSRSNLERTLTLLAGDLPPNVEPAQVTDETGRRRARQGVPLEVVLRAYRMAGRLLWDRMCRASRERFGGAHDAALLTAADRVWRLIDSSSDRLVDSYRREEAHLRSQDLGRRYAMTEGLLQGRGREPGFARDAARELGLAGSHRMVVVVAPHEPGVDDTLDGAREALDAAGFPSLWHGRLGETVGVVSVPAASPTPGTAPGPRDPAVVAVSAALRTCVRGPVGVSAPVAGLDRLDVAHGWARRAAATLPATGPSVAALDDRLPEALLAESPELAGRLRRAAFGGVLDLPEPERRTLIDTLAATLAAGGSPTRAAADLYCHRNTVMYRLARLESLTGRRLADERDRLVLALGLLSVAP